MTLFLLLDAEGKPMRYLSIDPSLIPRAQEIFKEFDFVGYFSGLSPITHEHNGQ